MVQNPPAHVEIYITSMQVTKSSILQSFECHIKFIYMYKYGSYLHITLRHTKCGENFLYSLSLEGVELEEARKYHLKD